jgi:hypothetical protein
MQKGISPEHTLLHSLQEEHQIIRTTMGYSVVAPTEAKQEKKFSHLVSMHYNALHNDFIVHELATPTSVIGLPAQWTLQKE